MSIDGQRWDFAAGEPLVTEYSVKYSPAMAAALQDFVKATIAPCRYPRSTRFATARPKTQTGKVQRFRLREGG